MQNQVKKLDADCASKIRKSQVITKVSDVVRELVDNSVDSGSQSIQIILENFGLNKIEVKDSGSGICAADIPLIFNGGYTSKLNNDAHLSCDDQYGFRGEALAAICSFSGITISTKTLNDEVARKYVVNKRGKVVSENPVALPNGTVITVRELFSDLPVRYKISSELKVCRNELKEIESYLKSLSIANPTVYVALHHNGILIWSKPSVKNTEQAITTVLGVALARKLARCPLFEFVPEQNKNENEASWKGKLELFVPQPPIDMKCVGFTSNKMTMVFVNRRRVRIDGYEKLIKRYAVGAANGPTQADQRKYPAAVFLIEVPPTEVDFNREINKSKVFLCCHDEIIHHLEEMLQSFYGIDLNFSSASQSQLSTPNVSIMSETESELDSSLNSNSITETRSTIKNRPNSNEVPSPPEKHTVQILNPPLTTPEKRKENILSFLGDISTSSNFSKCDTSVHHSIAGVSSSVTENKGNSSKFVFKKETPLPPADFSVERNREPSTSIDIFDNSLPIANFTISTPAQSLVETPDVSSDSIFCSGSSGNVLNTAVDKESRKPMNINFGENNHDNFQVPSSSTIPKPTNEVTSDFSRPIAPIFTQSSFSKSSVKDDDFLQCGAILHTNYSLTNPTATRMLLPPRSPLSYTPVAKKPKLFETPFESYTPRSEGNGRKTQVTLESLKNWNSAPRSSSNVLKLPGLKNTNKSFDIFEDIELDETLIPHTLNYLESKKNKENENDTVQKSINSATNNLGLLGLTAKVSLVPLKVKNCGQKLIQMQKTRMNVSVISQLENSKYYIVKVDDLLGVFDPEQVLIQRPHLEFHLPFNVSDTLTDKYSKECICFLLEEFTKFSATLDKALASRIFQVLTDLHEFEEGNNQSQWFYGTN